MSGFDVGDTGVGFAIISDCIALKYLQSRSGRFSPVILSFFLAFVVMFNPGIGGNVAVADNNSGAAFKVWPDTGQNKCYDNESEITCPAKGEPFYGQDAQYQGPKRSYTKLGYGGVKLPNSATPADGWIMTQDNVTGLIWEIKTDDGGINDKDNTYTWCDHNSDTNGGNEGTCGDGTDTEDFISALNSANFGGYSDWRLPTIKELLTLVNSGVDSPTIDIYYFPNTQLSSYWSATADASAVYDNYAWRVDFFHGGVNGYAKDNTYHVRAVRSGQSKLADNLVDNNNGTITDITTGLMWQKCSMGQNYNSATNGCDGEATEYTWQQGLEECQNLTLAGYDDWRLPSRNEIQSIIDYSVDEPAIDVAYFPGTEQQFYWSSTTYDNDMSGAWSVFFQYGYIGSNNKISSNYVRAVRFAQDFFDVPLDYWAYDYIRILYASGITAGCGNGNFCPENSVTRAQMSVFLERGINGADYTPPSASGNEFVDVDQNYWAAAWIEKLYADRITAGCGHDKYCPEDPVTRAQMSVFLLRAKHGADYTPPASTGMFDDVPTDYWAADWIEQLYAEGITSGCGNGNFCPEDPVTRAQMAVFLVRTFELE